MEEPPAKQKLTRRERFSRTPWPMRRSKTRSMTAARCAPLSAERWWPTRRPCSKFRHLLERHHLTERVFEEVNALLAERGAFLRGGTIVDATIIAAAPSTKNKAKAQMRAYVEPPFHVVKNLFKPRKVRYRGLAKNTAQLHALFALANPVLVQRTPSQQTQA